jgi:hypothetical protein
VETWGRVVKRNGVRLRILWGDGQGSDIEPGHDDLIVLAETE